MLRTVTIALTLALTACTPKPASETTSPCDIGPVRQDVGTLGALRLELWVAKELCVAPEPETTNLSGGAVSVRIFNTGQTPVQLVAADPEATFVTKVWDADRSASMIEFDLGPEPEDVPTVHVEIAPGESWQSAPIEHYMNTLALELRGGRRIDGTSLPEGGKQRRRFGLQARFAATVNAGAGFVAMEQTFEGEIDVVMVSGGL